MSEIDRSEELLTFFKALSDENRLKIVGFLAQKPYTVEDLAAALRLSVSTTSHHLSRLAKAGLVTARAEGHYAIYSLRAEHLQSMAQNLLQGENLPKPSEELSEDVFERKVLANFTDADGRITAFPAQLKKYHVLLRYVVRAFEPGVRYTEKQVNEILLRYHEDTADLRRGLIDARLMAREVGGSAYWRVEEPPARV